jgi:hypothetical protein
VGQIFVGCGHSPQTLKREADVIWRKLKEPSNPWDPTGFDYVALAHIITHWRHDAAYVDSAGQPIPLPLHGEGPCLAALIERVLPGRDVAEVVRSLMRSKAVRRRKGLYVPAIQFVALTDRSAQVHSLDTLSGMMDTVQHNMAGRGPYRLFERAALNPGVPDELLPAFHRRLEERAMRFITPTDTELRDLEASASPGPRSRVGVVVFVFQSPARARSGGTPTHRPNRRRRGGR